MYEKVKGKVGVGFYRCKIDIYGEWFEFHVIPDIFFRNTFYTNTVGLGSVLGVAEFDGELLLSMFCDLEEVGLRYDHISTQVLAIVHPEEFVC